jgi:hypothetical protein
LVADELLDDKVLLLATARHLVERWRVSAKTSRRRAAPSAKVRIARRVAEAEAVEKITAQIKERVVLDMIMPNGERLRFCTGKQVAGFGAGFAKLAERVGADCLVGEMVCENEAAELILGGNQAEPPQG